MEAERIVAEANRAREQLAEQALQEARVEEERFEARIPELHAAFLDKALERAEKTVSELQRKYDERHTYLRRLAEERDDEAVEAVEALVLQTEGGA